MHCFIICISEAIVQVNRGISLESNKRIIFSNLQDLILGLILDGWALILDTWFLGVWTIKDELRIDTQKRLPTYFFKTGAGVANAFFTFFLNAKICRRQWDNGKWRKRGINAPKHKLKLCLLLCPCRLWGSPSPRYLRALDATMKQCKWKALLTCIVYSMNQFEVIGQIESENFGEVV